MKTQKEAKKDIAKKVKKNGGTISVDELYDYVVSHMTPEEGLKKMLKSSLIHYENLKFDSKHESVHPIMIITYAAWDLGWEMIAVENKDGKKLVEGLTVGTKDYMDRVFKKNKKPKPPKK